MEIEPPAGLAELPAMMGQIARAEARVWATMVEVAEDLAAQYEHSQAGHRLGVALSSITTEIGWATSWSEAQVDHRLAAAARLKACGPHAWAAFGQGRFDAARAMEISRAFDNLTRAESQALLDESVIPVAETSTVAELRNWLRVFLAETEPQAATQRAEAERADRHVRVTHGEDAMAWFGAYIPSVAAEAIDRRLDRVAREMDGDERTLMQRRADLFMAWMTSDDGGSPGVGADIAVVIDAATLAGAAGSWVVSEDDRWSSPAAWLFDYIDTDSAVWHRLITDPDGGVLDYRQVGRFPSETLKIAIRFRDRVCQVPGCVKAARACDVDHRVPYPVGETTGANLGPLCRRHHRMKSHGVLRWILPSGQSRSDRATTKAPP